MLDAGAFAADIKTIAHLSLELRHEFLAQEGGDVIGLDGVDGGAAEVLIQGLEIGLFAEHDVGRVLALVHAPEIVPAQAAMDGTEAAGELVQLAMQLLDAQIVGDPLRPLPVGNTGEGIVQQRVIDLLRRSRTASQLWPLK